MSRKPSFEDALKEKLNELPLPDENTSWQKMSALLDKKEKRGFFFFFMNGKALGGALLLCILIGGWLLFSTQTKTGSGRLVIDEEVVTPTAQNADSGRAGTGSSPETRSKQVPATSAHHDTISTALIHSVPSSITGNHSLSGKNKRTPVYHNGNDAERESFTHQLADKETRKNKTQQTSNLTLQTANSGVIKPTATEQNQPAFIIDSSLQASGVITSVDTSSSTVISTNQSTITTNSNLPKTDSASTSTTTKTSIKIKPRSTWFLDAGIGVTQPLPINNQQFTSRNYNGNKSWFGDYVPFFYTRLEKENKWFLQGEFHYAAPRLIKGISYWQKTKVDYSHGIADKDIYHLQKTWYHQVPASLNIYVHPSWSIGAGAVYNIFYGAAANRVASTYDAASGQYSNVSTQLHWRGYTDSFLYKTNMSLLLQTNYQINRWSFGLRYLHDMHPFITYTLPDGTKKDARNTSLEIMIRYRFYRSHKFRIGNL